MTECPIFAYIQQMAVAQGLTYQSILLHIRYSPEHIHLLGVIPGPKEADVQPFLAPLVDEFLDLWEGCQISSTSLMPEGRSIQAALIPVVCDMPAARKVIGFVPPKSTMACPYCKCTYTDLSRREVILNGVARRNREEWLSHAEAYRRARTDSARKNLKKMNGVSWSELLRLPYWDPTRYTVVDAMHNLLLGLLQHHIRSVWLVEEATKQTKPQKLRKSGQSAAPTHVRKQVRKALQPTLILLAHGHLERTSDPDRWTKLQKSSVAVLEQLCATRKLRVQQPGQRKLKEPYIQALKAWAGPNIAQDADQRGDEQAQQPDVRVDEAEPDTTRFRLLPQELTQIREIIDCISIPSWLGRVATDFGSPGHGSPKSDEWRTAGTIHLPMALVSMWAGTPRQEELDWFLELVTAVQLATRRSTTTARAEEYRSHLQKYLLGLCDRGFKLKPNHHAAMHLADFLPEFGPTRGWWMYPIERQVGMLQKFNTNDRYGENL
ncbi:hypothetical protein AURDEDRAFT_125187 [Auricularia subglabra TFB-10046 SS5]|uniref:Uncharacterized protein n=1 Tax=Auricularia subglabra (strain TFB-10046 / SS5) TaxID=717982 RepID=J0WXZ5_AURST|nr:hypothetical protein AURDEDRAFT_125187 [Auricularia subglabra TFB-10046 SS5]